MMYKDFILLNVPGLLARKEIPETGRWKKVALAFSSTKVHFLIDAGLLKEDVPARSLPVDQAVIRLSDLTAEGQDFIMSGADDNWLGACDRKSNKMLAEGATEEERLNVYRDSSGLYKRLEKFRKERTSKSN